MRKLLANTFAHLGSSLLLLGTRALNSRANSSCRPHMHGFGSGTKSNKIRRSCAWQLTTDKKYSVEKWPEQTQTRGARATAHHMFITSFDFIARRHFIGMTDLYPLKLEIPAGCNALCIHNTTHTQFNASNSIAWICRMKPFECKIGESAEIRTGKHNGCPAPGPQPYSTRFV